MEVLYTALREAAGKRKDFYAGVAAGLILLGGLAVMGDSWNFPVLAVTAAACVSAVLLIWFFCRSAWALRRKLAALLRGKSFADRFWQTAEAELANDSVTVFQNREYRLRLFLTARWLNLNSANCSLIRPSAELLGAERVLLENEYEHTVCFRFADGDVICRCEHICDELVEIVAAIK